MQDFIGQPEKIDIGRSFELVIMLILCTNIMHNAKTN